MSKLRNSVNRGRSKVTIDKNEKKPQKPVDPVRAKVGKHIKKIRKAKGLLPEMRKSL